MSSKNRNVKHGAAKFLRMRYCSKCKTMYRRVCECGKVAATPGGSRAQSH